jgi:hypothetical protein
MSRTGWIVVGLVVLSIGSCMNSRYREKQEQRERYAAVEQQTRDAVRALAAKTGADMSWERRLAGDDPLRRAEVLTHELQAAWITGRPIIFIGAVQDVLDLSPTVGTVELHHSGIGRDQIFLASEFGVRVTCTREVIDGIVSMQRRPEALLDEVAVAATINQVVAAPHLTSDGERATLRLGIGTCIGWTHVPAGAFDVM